MRHINEIYVPQRQDEVVRRRFPLSSTCSTIDESLISLIIVLKFLSPLSAEEKSKFLFHDIRKHFLPPSLCPFIPDYKS